VNPSDLPRGLGWLLVAGAIVFWAGAVTPPYRQWMGVPIEEYLTIVGANRPTWYLMHVLFAVGTVLTLAGLSGLGGVLRSSGDRIWSTTAATLFSVAATLWLVQIGYRLSVTPWASSELSQSGQVPLVYVAMQKWMGFLFAAFMLMAYVAVAAYGVALLKTPLVARWAAWTAMGFGLLGVPGLATPLFQPPLMVFVAPFLIGVAILRAAA
jgi:hypothetical protein